MPQPPIIDLFGIISTKQELDHAADQMVKQIQLSGGINSETDSLFDFLCSEIEGAENITYSIDATYKTPTPSGMSRAIQLGTPFYTQMKWKHAKLKRFRYKKDKACGRGNTCRRQQKGGGRYVNLERNPEQAGE